MPKREKVIKELEWIIVDEDVFDTMYAYGLEDVIETMKDALSLLKKQKAVKPLLDYDGNDVWRCGKCHCNIFHPSHTDADEDEKNYRRFCFYCGRAVKWE